MVEFEKYFVNKREQEKEKIYNPINTSHAMEEVEKYLTEKNESSCGR